MAEKVDPALIRMLAAVPIFAPLGDKMLRALASEGQEQRYKAGDKLVAQGDKGVGLFLILEGTVEVRHGEKPLASLGAGQFFGEMALLENQERTADVVATSPVRCLVVSSWEFWGTLSKEPEVIRLLFQETVRRLRTPNAPAFRE